MIRQWHRRRIPTLLYMPWIRLLKQEAKGQVLTEVLKKHGPLEPALCFIFLHSGDMAAILYHRYLLWLSYQISVNRAVTVSCLQPS